MFSSLNAREPFLSFSLMEKERKDQISIRYAHVGRPTTFSHWCLSVSDGKMWTTDAHALGYEASLRFNIFS